MDNRRYLLQIAKGENPQRCYYRMFEYRNGVKTLLQEEETDWNEDINVVIVKNKEELKIDLENENKVE